MISEQQPDAPKTTSPETGLEPSPADAPPPRGNPESDQESVRRGEEQLDKVSGN